MKPMFAILLAACLIISGCGKTAMETCADEIEKIASNGGDGMASTCNGLDNQANLAAVQMVMKRNPGLKISLSRDGAELKQKPVQEAAEQKAERAPASETNPTKKPILHKAAAKVRGNDALKLIETAMKDLNVAVETHDLSGFVRYVSRPLHEEIMTWNAYEYPNEFEACRGALLEAHSYAMTFHQEYLSGYNTNGVRNRKDREWADKHLKEYRAQCRLAIRS